MRLLEGECFDHYQIRSHIAQGGTGDVYRAFDLVTGHEVALKIPTRSATLNAARYEQFLREMEALAILQHPAVQHAVESGRYNNTPFLVTDWVEGLSLRHLIQETGAFPLDRAILLTCRIASGLAYCHQQEVVHRDLKPENIIITQGDQPVILDFGLALTKARPGLGKAAGTPEYVAPEQIEGLGSDPRSDVYSLGAIYYELLTGAPPFVGADAADVIDQRQRSAAPRLDQAKPGISRQLATVVARCLHYNPDRRYRDMTALIQDLEHVDQVDTRDLESLAAAPPRPPFLKTQFGQIILMLVAFVVFTTLLTLAAVALKP